MIARLLLSARGNGTDTCRECDDPLDGPGPECVGCAGLTLIERLDRRYSDDQGIAPLWISGYEAPYRELVREFSPLRWDLGLSWQHDPGDGSWPRAQSWWSITVAVGPWSWTFRRVRPAGAR